MVRYDCSNCGEAADSVNGCPSCGRTPEQEVAALGLMIIQMQQRYKDVTDSRVLMSKRIQSAITRRTLLEQETHQVPRRGMTAAVRRASKGGQPGPARTPVPGQRSFAKGENSAPQNRAPGTNDGAGNSRPGGAAPIQRRPTAKTAAPPEEPPHGHPPETSTRSSQNVLLGLGALLFAVAAVVLTRYLGDRLGAGGQLLIFLVLTVLALSTPLALAKAGLTATAETVASVGFVFILVDGSILWSAAGLARTGLTEAGYAGVVCLGAAGVAAAYRTFSHLLAPRFAAVLLVQPVMPLLGFSVINGISAWATVFAAVAAADLALALVLTGLRTHGPGPLAWLLAGPRQPQLTRRTPYLIDAVWGLQALGVLVGVVCAVVALGRADTVTDALGGAAALLIASVVGMGGGLLLRRPPLPDLGVALATLAVIGAFGRLAAVAAPGRGLFCTALAVLGAAVALRLIGVVGPPRSTGAAPATAEGTAAGGGGPGSATTVRGAAAGTGPTAGRPAGGTSADSTPAGDTSADGNAGTRPAGSGAGRLGAGKPGAGKPSAGGLSIGGFGVAGLGVALFGVGGAADAGQGRRGARWAGLIAAVTVGVIVLLRGLAAIIAPVRAALPGWHADLTSYPATLADAAGPHGAQLCLAALVLAATAVMFGPADRGDVITAFGGLAVLLAPATLGLPWAITPLVGTVAALAAGGYALAAGRPRSAWVRAITALLVGASAAGTALARPGAAALTLAVLAVGGAIIGSAPRLATNPSTLGIGNLGIGNLGSSIGGQLGSALGRPSSATQKEAAAPPARLIRARSTAADLALGGAAFALPGAVACATAALIPAGSGPRPILAATFLAVAGTLCATALTQVAWERSAAPGPEAGGLPAPSRLIALGASLGAAVLAIAALRTDVGPIDRGVALLLLLAGTSLLFAPWLDDGRRPGRRRPARQPGEDPRRVLDRLTGSDVSAVVVTTAAIAAVTRVGSLIVPKYALTSAAVVVLLVAAGIRAIPLSWRRGPVIGAGVVAAIVGALAGVTAVRAALAVIRAAEPVWHTDLLNWSARVTEGYAGQVPLALVLLAAAAAIGLPRPWSQEGLAAALGLAALAAPACLGLTWWSPIMLSGLAATIFGVLAGATRDPRAAWVRFGVAGVLFADTVAASLVQPVTTTTTLFAAAAINGAVAGTAAYTRRRIDVVRVPPKHLTLIGGGALAAAVLTVPAAFACLAASRHADAPTLLTTTLAGLCLAFAIAALACYDDAELLLYVTVAVAAGGTVIAVGTLQAGLPVEVYAAAAALLVVLSELMRAAVLLRRASRAKLRPRASDQAGATPTGRPGYTVFFAAGPATVLAVVWLAPRVIAALFGPYQQVNAVWSAAPPDSAKDGLGHLASWAGNGNSVVAALLLTIAAALGAVGFGGSDRQIGERAVAVVIPGAAITLLIAPAALGLGWTAGPLAALLVAALCGLGVALSYPPADRSGSPLVSARRIVTIICVLATAAGLSGALATQGMTLVGLTITAGCGLVAALAGQTRPARLVGWLVTGIAGHLVALVLGRVLGLPVYQSAFLVAAVAAGMLVLAALLPRLRQPEAANESITVEATAYAGAFFALLLASREQAYLATFCTAWGVVLGIAAARPGRPRFYRRALIWLALGHEVAAWWLYMHLSGVHVLEAYSAAVAVAALFIGWLETHTRPELSSWSAYGVALVAAFLPTLTLVLSGTEATPWRRVLLIVAAAATVVVGTLRRQQAPVIIGAVALVLAALYELKTFSTAALLWTVLGIVALVLVGLGAGTEQRRRRSEQIRGAWGKLR